MGEVEALVGRAPRLNEQIVDELRARIAHGRIKPGQHLSESAIAAELGVSRTPVRGAFRALLASGDVVSAPHGGVVVSREPRQIEVAAQSGLEGSRPSLVSIATWEGIYRDLSAKAVARAAYGSWRIIETDLAKSYGVSRTVAREVLARLEHVGIIRKDERSRWFLPALTHRRIRQLYEMRWILEPVALRNAAPRTPRLLLEEMREELAVVIASPELAAPSEFGRLERRLHVNLLSYGDNEVLIESLQHFHALLVTNAQLYNATCRAFESDPFMGEHLEIVESLLDQRVDDAAQQIEHHLKTALNRALTRIDYMVANLHHEPLAFLKPLDD